MSPELGKILAIIVPLFISGLLWMALRLMYSAGKSMVEAKTVDPVSVGIVIFILVLVLIGVRYYPPALANAFLDGFRETWGLRAEIEEIISGVVNESQDSWNSGASNGNSDAPIVISTPDGGFPTAIPIAPTPNMFQETATAYFATAMPPQPTETPRPMIEPTRTPVPLPTVFICRSSQDVLAGCQPPTPMPGN
jgi:hypothetical protein